MLTLVYVERNIVNRPSVATNSTICMLSIYNATNSKLTVVTFDENAAQTDNHSKKRSSQNLFSSHANTYFYEPRLHNPPLQLSCDGGGFGNAMCVSALQ